MESTAPKIVLAAELTSGWETECGTQVNSKQRFLRR